jgi:hypothetical protein
MVIGRFLFGLHALRVILADEAASGEAYGKTPEIGPESVRKGRKIERLIGAWQFPGKTLNRRYRRVGPFAGAPLRASRNRNNKEPIPFGHPPGHLKGR